MRVSLMPASMLQLGKRGMAWMSVRRSLPLQAG